MRAIESKTTASNLQAKKAGAPFFGKEGRDAFFSQGPSNGAQDSTPFFSPSTIQPRLTIGQPGDKYEQEADAMADQVVQRMAVGRSPLSVVGSAPGVQRECAECAAEDKEEALAPKLQPKAIFESDEEQPLQRKCAACQEEGIHPKHLQRQGGPSAAPSDLESRLSATKGGGAPLPKDTRGSMESAFGADFSGVRVHTGSQSMQMNQELGAQAFTHGSDVYFNQGKYDTGSGDGQRLLAHELTHVVQQGGGRIQRATDPEFVIKGKYPGAHRDNNIVYFDFGSNTPDPDERAKIETLATNTTQNYDLIGFASEEGTDAVNRNLAQNRINVVDGILRDNGHTGTRVPINNFGHGADKIDYRRLRKVEINDSGTPSSEPDCEPTSANPNPELVNCGTSFTDAHPIALRMAFKAYLEMILGSLGLFTSKRNWINNVITVLFGSASHFDDIKTHLGNLFNQILDQPNTVRCHNVCDNTCRNATAYMDGSTGPGAVLTLCPPFYNDPNVQSRSETLVHEALHATTGLATEDLAYGSERGITYLDPAIALKNTDSYVNLILELNNPGSIVSGVGGTRDNIDASITGTELEDLKRVMAYLEKWIIESTAETSSLYDIIVEVRDAGTWSGVSYPYYQDTMNFLAPLFGLTIPPTVPSEQDQVAVAGIFDRLMRSDNLLWGTNIDIHKDDSGPTHFSPGPDEPLYVNSAFLSSGQHSMAYLLVEKIIEATNDISGAHKPKYVQLIEKIRVHAGHSAP